MSILAIDQGTTSSRAIVFDEKLNMNAVSQYPTEQFYPQPGWVEHDAEQILSTVLRAISDVLKKTDEKIDAVGITNQRETVVLWDKKTGKPVHRAIVWQCRRTADFCTRLEKDGFGPMIREKTGLPIDAYFSASKVRWMLDNVEGLRERAEKGEILMGTIDCWLIWNLSGRKSHVTDATNACRTMLYNIHTGDWDEDLLKLFGIPSAMLPKVVDTAGKLAVTGGKLIPEKLVGTPISSAVGDQQGALFGQTCFDPGDAKNTYGTGCFTLMNTGKEPVSTDKLISMVAWQIGGERDFAPEGSVFNGGSSIQWLRDELKIIKSAPEADVLAESVPDTKGVYFVSAFTGLGAPHWDMYARGCLVGLTRGIGRAEVCRAVLEGIAFQVRDLLKTMEKESGRKMTSLFVDGGASVSDIMMQFQADIANCAVDRPKTIESTARGAAMLAMVGAGLSTLDGLRKTRESDKIYKPQMPAKTRAEKLKSWKNAIKASKIVL